MKKINIISFSNRSTPRGYLDPLSRDELCQRCSLPRRTTETVAQYHADRRSPTLANRLNKNIRDTLPDWKRVSGSRHTRGLYGARVFAWKRPKEGICHTKQMCDTSCDTPCDTQAVGSQGNISICHMSHENII